MYCELCVTLGCGGQLLQAADIVSMEMLGAAAEYMDEFKGRSPEPALDMGVMGCGSEQLAK